jgi:hypothetical protein
MVVDALANDHQTGNDLIQKQDDELAEAILVAFDL